MSPSKILVVEDDPVISLALANRLKKLGYEICGAVATGEEARRSVQETAPDLILMDIKLKGNIDGIEAAELIRSGFDIPVVYVSAFADDALLARAKLSEPFGYIVKPFGERELRTTVEIALYKHRAEKKVRQSEQRFRKLAELAPIALTIVSRDGTFQYSNAMFTEMFGYQADEIRDLGTWRTLTLPDREFPELVGPEGQGLHDLGAEMGNASAWEGTLTCKNGEEKIVAVRTASLEDSGTIITFQDVTPAAKAREQLELLVRERTRELVEQKNSLEQEICQRLTAEEALRASEHRFRAVFQSAGECVFVKDSAGRYVQVNPQMEKLVGLPASDLIGLTDETLYGEAANHIREVESRVLQGETVEEEHRRLVNGSPATFHDTRTPLTDGNGDVIGIIGISRDVTELRGAMVRKKVLSPRFVAKSTTRVLERILLAAKRDCVVLLFGESGSGKDWFARYIHDHSRRSSSPFFAVNCAAIASELAESELFGHERGSFTGAGRRKRGLLELAEGGTLLLNEIGEMPLPLQAKLLTFLDTRSFTRLGGEELVKVNARLVVATNRNLAADVETGAFRRDLFYRLNVFPILIPPLRERVEDLPAMVEDILTALAADLHVSTSTKIDPSAMDALSRYQWPGNIRELRNVIERALIVSKGGVIWPDNLQLDPKQMGQWQWATSFPSEVSFNTLLRNLKVALIDEALGRAGGKKTQAARLLGMTRDALKKQMKTLGMPARR